MFIVPKAQIKQDAYKNNEILTVSTENAKRRLEEIGCLITLFIKDNDIVVNLALERYSTL